MTTASVRRNDTEKNAIREAGRSLKNANKETMYISWRVTESTRCVFVSFVPLCFFAQTIFGQHQFTTSAQKSPGAS